MRASVSKRFELAGGAEVADDEGTLVDPPQSFALGEFGKLVDLNGGQAEDRRAAVASS